MSGLNSRLAEIDENLVRNDLTVLEQATWLHERKVTYLELYPETKKGAVNQHTKELLSAESANSKSFTESTADKTSQSKRTLVWRHNSIKTIKLLSPIVVNYDKQLICGGRLVKTFQHLGMNKILAHIVDIESILTGEYTKKEVRKDFTRSG